jgi:hypothetical protein
MRSIFALVLVAVLSSSAAAQTPVVPCPDGKCPAPARATPTASIRHPGPAYAPVRSTVGYFRERRPVRRLVAAPLRLVFGRCR